MGASRPDPQKHACDAPRTRKIQPCLEPPVFFSPHSLESIVFHSSDFWSPDRHQDLEKKRIVWSWGSSGWSPVIVTRDASFPFLLTVSISPPALWTLWPRPADLLWSLDGVVWRWNNAVFFSYNQYTLFNWLTDTDWLNVWLKLITDLKLEVWLCCRLGWHKRWEKQDINMNLAVYL